MNTKNIVKINLFFSILLLICSCNPPNKTTAYYTFETECLGVELDGSQTLKSWGKGNNKSDAIEQAKKNAVNDILFKGIRKGSSECSLKPLIVEVNAQEKHEQYFFTFFSDEGPYTQFISDEDKAEEVRYGSGKEIVYEITVRVLRNELKKQLINDKILNQ